MYRVYIYDRLLTFLPTCITSQKCLMGFTSENCLYDLSNTITWSKHHTDGGRLGRAMVLGSFQCRGVLRTSHIVGQGCLQQAGWVAFSFFFFFFFFFFFVVVVVVFCFVLFFVFSLLFVLLFFLFCFFFHLVCPMFSNASSVVRRLDILKYCGLGRYKPVVVVSYYRGRAYQVLVNR